MPTSKTAKANLTEGEYEMSIADLQRVLSKKQCYQDFIVNPGVDALEEATPHLPEIDLFLNPSREGELREAEKWLREQEATRTTVNNIFLQSCSNLFSFSGGDDSYLPRPFSTTLALHAPLLSSSWTILPFQGGPHVAAVLLAGKKDELLRDLHPGDHRHWRLLLV